MKSKNFIKNKLKDLYSQFKNIKIRYEYRANVHIIEVLPFSFYAHNEEYMVAESKIENEFESKFPGEEILFITKGFLIKIMNPEFELGFNNNK